jgi:hypothetical protein
MSAHSNLELNSFLTNLMGGWDEHTAVAVIDSFHELPLAKSRTRIEKKTRNDASVTGHTDEAGNVTIPDKEIKETIVGESEEEVARVGHYKVKRMAINNGQSFAITWHHFWASDITTMNLDKAPSPMFGVEYVKDELKPIALVRWDFVVETGTAYYTWRDYVAYLKAFVSNFLLLGQIPEMHARTWIAHPTVLFGQSKMKATHT